MRLVHRLFNDPRLLRFFLAARAPLAVAAAAALLPFLKREWFWPGLAVAAAGELLQCWCFACIAKQKELAVNGPYKVVRNPMYLARFLLILGFLLMTGNPWLCAGFSLLYYFYMVNRVRREESKLVTVFGPEYGEYCRRVGRFVPFAGRWPAGRGWHFDRACFLRNHAHWNALAAAAFGVVCYVVLFVVRR